MKADPERGLPVLLVLCLRLRNGDVFQRSKGFSVSRIARQQFHIHSPFKRHELRKNAEVLLTLKTGCPRRLDLPLKGRSGLLKNRLLRPLYGSQRDAVAQESSLLSQKAAIRLLRNPAHLPFCRADYAFDLLKAACFHPKSINDHEPSFLRKRVRPAHNVPYAFTMTETAKPSFFRRNKPLQTGAQDRSPASQTRTLSLFIMIPLIWFGSGRIRFVCCVKICLFCAAWSCHNPGIFYSEGKLIS